MCPMQPDDETRVQQLLRYVDHPPPQIDAEMVAARAREGGRGWGRWAAAVLVALGLAGAAYAMPGSPVREWVKHVAEWIGGRSQAAPLAPTPGPAPGTAGIAVTPGADFVILFTARQAEGVARVSVTDGAEVVVRAMAGSATFTSEVDRLVVDNTGSSASFEILVPRSAPRVGIWVNGKRILLKNGPVVTTEEPADASGLYLLPLTP